MKRIKKDNPNTQAYWNNIYSNELSKGIRRENFDRFSLALDFISTGDKVLEVGCGKGEFFEFLDSKREIKYTGVDISDVAIQHNKKSFLKGVFEKGEVHSLPFVDNRFDKVIAMEVLEHIDALQEFSDEAKRVLKVGGKFIAILPYKNRIDSSEHIWSFDLEDINKYFYSKESKRWGKNHIIVEWTKKELVMDFDDFSEDNNNLDLLKALKKEIPNLKVTLFTVPSKCSKEFLREVLHHTWLELAVHGDKHTHLECSTWTKEKTLEVLDKVEATGCYEKIFKPPFWAGSEGLYEALSERNYIVAQTPKAVVGDNIVYRLNENSVHCHIQNVCNNGLEESFEYLKSLKGNNFKFISEIYE